MRTLNDMPEGWREADGDDWTPLRGLLRGTLLSGAVAVVIAVGLFTLTRYVPLLTSHWLLGPLWGFALTWLLLAVMHEASGMVGPLQTAVTLALVFVILGLRHAAGVTAHGGTWTVLDLLNPEVVLLFNFPHWIGAAAAAWMCKDGESILHDVAENLSRNALTGQQR